MVIELISQAGWGGARYALDFIERSLAQNPAASKDHLIDQRQRSLSKPVQKPWCFLEASSASQLYLPSLSPTFRKAVAEGRLLWVRASEDLAPGLGQSILESGLCEGVLLRELDQFAKSSPAALWGRRWQLAAKRSNTHLLWLHHKPQAVIGFDVRLEWTSRQEFEIKKGYGYLQDSLMMPSQLKEKIYLNEHPETQIYAKKAVNSAAKFDDVFDANFDKDFDKNLNADLNVHNFEGLRYGQR